MGMEPSMMEEEGGEGKVPMEGPPSTRMISLDEPPLSDTGRT
jgi:hypothetical protein